MYTKISFDTPPIVLLNFSATCLTIVYIHNPFGYYADLSEQYQRYQNNTSCVIETMLLWYNKYPGYRRSTCYCRWGWCWTKRLSIIQKRVGYPLRRFSAPGPVSSSLWWEKAGLWIHVQRQPMWSFYLSSSAQSRYSIAPKVVSRILN